MTPVVTIVIPCRNEELFIAKVLADIIGQDYPIEKIEVIIVDGHSDDKTTSVAAGFRDKLPQLTILDNDLKTVPHALNLAIYKATGDIIIRMDAHSEYNYDYVSKVIETFSETDADIVGGPKRAAGKTLIQKSIAYCTSTKMGVGDSAFHNETVKGWVDSVYLGAWKKEIFDDVGMFDTAMKRNQDDEFHYRARSKGKKIYLNPAIKSLYHPRDSFSKLFSQYFQYGLYKPLVLKKVNSGMKIRHLVPSLFVIYLLILPLLISIIGHFSLAFLGLYLAGLIYFSFVNQLSIAGKFISPIVYVIIHISYGLGFILGLSKSPGKHK